MTKKTELRPLHDRILIRRHEKEAKTPGGIIIPDTARDKLFEGTVLAVGPGKVLPSGKFHETTVKVGDHVIYDKYSGEPIKLGEEDLWVIREDNVAAVQE